MDKEQMVAALGYALKLSGCKTEAGRALWEEFRRRPNWESDARHVARQFGEMVEQEMVRMLCTPRVAALYEDQIVGDFFASLKDKKLTRALDKLRDILDTLWPKHPAVRPNPANAGTTGVAFGMHRGARTPQAAPEGGATFGPLLARPAVPESPPTRPVVQAPSVPAVPQPAPPPTLRDPVEHDPGHVSILSAEPVLPLEPVLQQDAAAPPGRPPDADQGLGKSMWKYLEVADPADRHTDFDFRRFPSSPGLSLFGARVRGRKHKHEGSNCDDWFEAGQAGNWEVVAVADGAGSCSLSRIGAEVSAKAATTFLCSRLEGVRLDFSGNPSPDVLQRDEQSGVFKHPTVEQLQQILHEAVWQAVEAVKSEAASRNEEVKKFSGTLRLAIHQLLPGTRETSFLMACSVGDGMTAAVDTAGRLHLLGLEESGGKHSGETEFLTDPRFVTPVRLTSETFALVLPVRSVMVMTDGIADPYFPNDTGMLRLYADLILNGVVDIPGVDAEARMAALQDRGIEVPEINQYSYMVDTPVGPEERVQARIRQADRFSSEINVTVEDLLRWPPALLLAGAPGEPMNPQATHAPPQERLKIWLDAFYVRGEFDDRTLVIMQREAEA